MTDTASRRDTLISKRENRRMFDAIARRYDLMNKIISLGCDRRWRQRAIDALGCVPGGRYLDVGSGTGDLAIDIVSREQRARVVGLDPSIGMLAIGREKIAASKLSPTVTFTAGDAMFLPFKDDSMDGIILGFCIRNVEDRIAAVREFSRVLKPGGRLVILELTVPENPFFSLGHRIYTSTAIPAISYLLTQKGAYDYLVKSVRAFPKAGDFLSEMKKVGFGSGEAIPLLLGSVTIFVLAKQNAE